MSVLGIVTGLQSEARIAFAAGFKAGLNHADFDVICAGPGLLRAEEAAHSLVRLGARVLLSFGIAGALVESLRPGTLLLPKAVAALGHDTLPTQDTRAQMLVHALGASLPVTREPLVSARMIIKSASQKAALAAASGAVAVDMESYAVGRVAKEAGADFAVLRAVADPAERAIPAAALAGMTPQGHVRPARVLSKLMREPAAMGDIMRLGRDNARAMRSLGSAARLAFPLFLNGR